MTNLVHNEKTIPSKQLVYTSAADPHIISSKVAEYVDLYQGFARRTVQSLVGLASTLVEAEAALAPKEFRDFCEQVRLQRGSSTYKKMMIIGKAAGRFEPVMDRLPNAWTVLYELAKLKSEPFEDLVTSHQLHPLMTGREIKELTGIGLPAPIMISDTYQTIAEIRLSSSSASNETTHGIIAAIRRALEPFDSENVKLVCDQTARAGSPVKTYGSPHAIEAAEARHIEQVESWLLHCLRRKAPVTVPISALKMVHALGLSSSIQDGPVEPPANRPGIPAFSVLKPTMAEFITALSQDYIGKMGSERYLAIVARAQEIGEWKEKIRVNGKLVSKKEQELKFFREIVKVAKSAEERDNYKSRIETMLRYVPDSILSLSDQEKDKRAQEIIDRTIAMAA